MNCMSQEHKNSSQATSESQVSQGKRTSTEAETTSTTQEQNSSHRFTPVDAESLKTMQPRKEPASSGHGTP